MSARRPRVQPVVPYDAWVTPHEPLGTLAGAAPPPECPGWTSASDLSLTPLPSQPALYASVFNPGKPTRRHVV